MFGGYQLSSFGPAAPAYAVFEILADCTGYTDPLVSILCRTMPQRPEKAKMKLHPARAQLHHQCRRLFRCRQGLKGMPRMLWKLWRLWRLMSSWKVLLTALVCRTRQRTPPRTKDWWIIRGL